MKLLTPKVINNKFKLLLIVSPLTPKGGTLILVNMFILSFENSLGILLTINFSYKSFDP